MKLWDIRRMDGVLGEIKFASGSSVGGPPSALSPASSSVGAIKWTQLQPGILSVAAGSAVQDYDTKSGSRPVLVRVNHARAASRIRDFALYPQTQAPDSRRSEGKGNHKLVEKLSSGRILTVLEERNICDMAKDTFAPVAISYRDGRIAHALGASLFMGSTESGRQCRELRFRVVK